MAKSIIQINEEQLKQLLSDTFMSVIAEIEHKTIRKPMESNINSNDELLNGKAVEILPNGKKQSISGKKDRENEMTYRVLTQGIIDAVGDNMILRFGRKEEDFTTSNLDFFFRELRLLTPKRFVIEGVCNLSRSKKLKRIQIDYKFDQQQFYEAVYCTNGTVRDMKPLCLDYAGTLGQENINTVQKLIQLLTKNLYSIENVQTDIINM